MTLCRFAFAYQFILFEELQEPAATTVTPGLVRQFPVVEGQNVNVTENSTTIVTSAARFRNNSTKGYLPVGTTWAPAVVPPTSRGIDTAYPTRFVLFIFGALTYLA